MSTKQQSRLRRDRLFALFDMAKRSGAQFSPISLVDEYIVNRRAAIFLKHDVHGVFLSELIQFARDESKRNIFGTYLFMTPDYPLAQPHYSFEEQCEAMQRIGELGHEIGLHIDPFFLIQNHHSPLSQTLSDIIRLFERRSISIKIGNIHGNSSLKHLDANGFETSFDLFDEMARQPDFPDLKNVPFPTAQIIRDNRVSLKRLGFAFWCDGVIWSDKYGFVLTDYLTDNEMGKKSLLKLFVRHDETGRFKTTNEGRKRSLLRLFFRRDAIGQYKLADSFSAICSNFSEAAQLIPMVNNSRGPLKPGVFSYSFNSSHVEHVFKELGKYPTLMLIHPQHYL